MNKVGYGVIYAMTIVVGCIFLLYMGKDVDEKGKSIKRQLYMVLLMNVTYIGALMTDSTKVLIFTYCVIQILECWILYSFLKFSCKFTEINLKNKNRIVNISTFMCICDTVLIFYNMVTGRLYGFRKRDVMYGIEEYMSPEINVWYCAHIILCLVIELVFISILMYKAFSVSYIYRTRYLSLGFFFTLGLIICLVVRIISNMSQFPIAITLTLGLVLIFYVYCYLPKIRISKMENFVIKNVTMPILMFDSDDELQVYNVEALDEFAIEKGMTLEEYISHNNLKYVLTPERRKAGKTKEFTLTEKTEEKTYLIHGQELWDNRKRFIGTLLVYNDITNQEKIKEQATFHATRDNLTGLWNREYFFEMASKTISENPAVEFVIIVADIYRFKLFNDLLGKKAGDDLLIAIAKTYEENMMPLWVFSRLGGDKFAMLMPAKDFRPEKLERVCNGIISKRDYKFKVHFYLGVYYIKDYSLTIAEMCDRACMALESIKGNLQKNIAYYEEEIRQKKLKDALNVDELDAALTERQFEIYLQPQIETVNNKLVGGEALVRWNNPKRGMISPNEFIPAFEENGMIARLDYYVWESACMLLHEWKKQGKDHWSVSVNISAKDFYLMDIYDCITGLVKKYEIEPEILKLEITETAFVLNVEEQMNTVRRLQTYGFVVEMDDFGSGYSSLNSLKDISVDVLKLDMKFFEKTNDPARAKKIIESVVKLAYNLKMVVIAEGVEEFDQVKMLQSIGCNVIQGYYYSKPLRVSEFEEYAKEYEVLDIREILKTLK